MNANLIMILATLLNAAITLSKSNITGWMLSATCEIYVNGVDIIKGHHNTLKKFMNCQLFHNDKMKNEFGGLHSSKFIEHFYKIEYF